MHKALGIMLLLSFATSPPARAADTVEMRLRVRLGRDRIGEISDRVLEFYEVGPEGFVAAFTRDDYEWLVANGYPVEVLVPDMQTEAARFDAAFHTYEQIRDTWTIIARDYPHICRLDTLGLSYNGNLLLAMKLTLDPEAMSGRPRICFDFTIHGNENNGTEIAHHALLQLVNGYGTDPDITRWVNTREIWLLPIVNPDGLISRNRSNGRGVDLNRNYGYSWNGGGSGPFSEPETQALYRLGVSNPMTMWTQYHSGTESAMWSWGYTRQATMDSVVHRYEMERYGEIAGYPVYQIARGLYTVTGGSTDWYYGATGALGFGIEVCYGQPSPPSQIDTINVKNWSVMKEMIERSAWGIGGRVTDSVTGAPLEARIEVDPPDWFTYSDSLGWFHKTLPAGSCSVTVRANGYASRTITGVNVPAESSAWLDVTLAPDTAAAATAFRVIACKLGRNNPTNAWWALGPRDGRSFALDRGGWATFDMGAHSPIVNHPGEDFYVVEGNDEPNACSVFVSNEWNGPWQFVGFGTGTRGYDLAEAGLDTARYVRIADDNVGTPGFGIDAVETVTGSVGVAAAPPPSGHTRLAVERNPFAGSTGIRYSLTRPGRVRLTLYDNCGRRVRTLLSGPAPAGDNRLNWPGDNDAGRMLGNGVYWLRLETEDGVHSSKLVKLD